ncbi:MAG: ActS/PrrB/RegB family redox-sensitive histidine kinase [Xanthobacteraceae bacterium]
MSQALTLEARRTERSVRLDTLVRLRWLAVVGQTTAVLVVYLGLDYELPIWACLAVIALAAWLNIVLRVRFPVMQRLEPDRAAWLLAFDIAELAVLLFFTGGLQNPFSLLLMGPVLLSATGLPPRMTLLLGGLAITCATVLIFVYYPLPWGTEPLDLPAHYVMGLWLSLLLSISFVGLHAWQITEEARQLANALTATELVLEREQHLSQLDGLAAAAAHELGTPLSTITVVARELERAMKPGSEYAEDVRLLNEQAQRCRNILGKLTELSAAGAPFDRMKLSLLIEEVVAPHRNFGIAINVALAPGETAEPVGGRNPAILYGLGNLLENAVDFARKRVDVAASWSGQKVSVTITDDGPGFAPEVMDRIGEPYVTSRRNAETGDDESGGFAASEYEKSGLGLGFFIAKTLLERSGASLDFRNRVFPERGAVVRVQWDRSEFEQALDFAT